MLRYLRLYAHFLRFSFSRAMEFRLDFCFRIGMDAIFYGVNFAFFWALCRQTPLFGGWSFDQVMIFMGAVFVVDAIQMTVLSNNMWALPLLISKGDLDYYLVRPVSSLYFVSLREFAANSFVNLLMAMAILIGTIVRYPASIGPIPMVLFVLGLLLGVFLQYCLQMMFLIPAFWLHTSHGLREIFFSLEQFANRPHGIFTGWVRRILISVLPFALIVSFPTRALFEAGAVKILAYMAGVTAVAFTAMRTMWRLGLRAYASASS